MSAVALTNTKPTLLRLNSLYGDKQKCFVFDLFSQLQSEKADVFLHPQVQLEGGRQQYRPMVMALTEKDILLFESVPWSRESWSMPLLTHPLLATRYRLQTAWGFKAGGAQNVHTAQTARTPPPSQRRKGVIEQL